jgi:hypothetical protein
MSGSEKREGEARGAICASESGGARRLFKRGERLDRVVRRIPMPTVAVGRTLTASESSWRCVTK